ncbi:MAG: hypothetical protein V8T19_03290 [Senegalimassilia anaerobia]
MTPTAKVEVWSTIAETYIPDTTKTSPRAAARRRLDGDPDIDKFPHWFEPKNSKVEAPRYYHKDQADQIATTDSYINDDYKGDHLMEEYKENLQKYGDDLRSS